MYWHENNCIKLEKHNDWYFRILPLMLRNWYCWLVEQKILVYIRKINVNLNLIQHQKTSELIDRYKGLW